MLADYETDVSQAVQGDLDQVEMLFRACSPKLRRWIELRLPQSIRSSVDADDVLQETFAEAFQEIGRCRAKCLPSFFQWVLAIAEHNLIDLQRGLFALRRDVRRTCSVASCELTIHRLALDLQCPHETPSWAARSHELADRLRWAIAELPADYREVVVRYDLRQLPIDEVADELGCSAGAVYMRRQRAHRLLRRQMVSFSRFLDG